MDIIHTLHAELEDLQTKYWRCFNNWDCREDLEKIECRIEELKYKISLESEQIPEMQEASRRILKAS